MKRKRFIFGIAAMGYSKLVVAAVQLALVPVLAHSWGLELYGHWLMLSAIPVLLSASDFGFSSAAGNKIISEVATDETDEALRTFQSAQIVILAGSTTVLMLALLLTELVPDRWLVTSGGMSAEAARSVLVILSLFCVVSLQSGLLTATVRSAGRFAQATSLEATIQLLEGAVVTVVVLKGGDPIDAALTYLAVRTLGVACHAGLAVVSSPWLRLGFAKAHRETIRQLVRPAVASMMLPLAYAGYLQGSILALGAAAGASAVPVYTTLRTVARIGIQLFMTVNLPLLPEFTAEYARKNMQWIRQVTGSIALLSMSIGTVAALLLWFFGGDLLHAWIRGVITPPPWLLGLIAISLVPGILWSSLSNFLLAINRHEGFALTFVCAGIVSVGATYVLALRFGVVGAAVSSLVLDIVLAATSITILRRVLGGFLQEAGEGLHIVWRMFTMRRR